MDPGHPFHDPVSPMGKEGHPLRSKLFGPPGLLFFCLVYHCGWQQGRKEKRERGIEENERKRGM